MDKVTFSSLVPEVEDKVIHSASFVVFHSIFDLMETIFETAAEVTVMLEGETVGASSLAPSCVTVIVLLRDPEDRLVSDTVTVPNRVEVLLFVEAFTVMVLPLVVTVSQSTSSVATKTPSVLTVIVFDPPSAKNVIDVGSTDR